MFIFGCAQQVTPPVGSEKTTITEQNGAIEKADKTLEDLEDTETDAELDDIENVLSKI